MAGSGHCPPNGGSPKERSIRWHGCRIAGTEAGDSAAGSPSTDADETQEGSAETAALSPAVAAQIAYVRAHWEDTSSEEFGYLPDGDCVNFTSQSLLARGWEADDEWWFSEVGDVVQFDWDDSGDRDHTGVVTSVETESDGSITILYAGHTDATLDRSVDWAITEHHPGGVAYYWGIPE